MFINLSQTTCTPPNHKYYLKKDFDKFLNQFDIYFSNYGTLVFFFSSERGNLIKFQTLSVPRKSFRPLYVFVMTIYPQQSSW